MEKQISFKKNKINITKFFESGGASSMSSLSIEEKNKGVVCIDIGGNTTKIVVYLENNIIGEYLDFSLERNSMIVSRDVIYTNLDNILVADIINVDIKTKDTKIFMYEKGKKVNIKSKN